jgi:hypothetical protein
MSERALPLLFINLGGEMLYVLDQRLSAQKIQNDKARKSMIIVCFAFKTWQLDLK